MKPIDVIIPAYNEAGSIGMVIKALPKTVREIVVVNNNSTDATQEEAKKAGATVLFEEKKGYGHACLKAMAYLEKKEAKPEIVVFLDGDFSDYPEELPKLIAPILEGKAVFTVGARLKYLREPGAMAPAQVFGNGLAAVLMKVLYGAKFTGLGPFRAIKYDSLMGLNMEDKTYGWTVEMQLKILKQKLPYTEVPVKYRKRSAGFSKVSGTVKGSVMAGIKIIGWIFKYSFK